VAQEALVSKDSLTKLAQSAYKFSEVHDVKKAIETGALIISVAERQEDKYYSYVGYNILGLVYFRAKDTLQARRSYEKALAVAKESKADSIVSWAYVNLGNLESQGEVNYLKGIEYYEKSIELNRKIDREKDNLVPNLNIGWTYLDQDAPDKAYPYLLTTQRLIAEYAQGNYRLECASDQLLGRYYLIKGQYDKSEFYLKRAAKAADENEYVSKIESIYEHYSQLEETRGNYDQALVYLQRSKEYEKKMFESEKIQEMEAASAKFRLEQYESTIADAQRQEEISAELVAKSKLLNYILIGATFLLLTGVIVIFLTLKSRNKFIKRLYKKNTQLEEAKLEAEKLSNLKTKFFSTVSHELRTPLYGVVGISSLLLDENTNPELEEDLKSLKFSGNYLLSLINDVLLMNKMDVDGVEIQKIPFKLSDLIQNISRSFEFSLEQNKNSIHLSVDPRVPNNLIGDSVRLSQILMNLIGNAIKFNENGNIHLNIDLIDKLSNGQYATRFIIKDDGIGIPKSKQESIFEEFSQVNNANYSYQGTGLGLPIVKRLLTLFDSKIVLESKLGEGATFSFVLNLEPGKIVEQPTENTSIAISNDKEESEGSVAARILIVDDNRINQKVTQKILEMRNYICAIADDGEEAIAMVKENTYDLILMDIHMPRIGGIEATMAIREFDASTPIIALTAVDLDEMRSTILDSGMNDIILKPYDVSQFLTTILKNLSN